MTEKKTQAGRNGGTLKVGGTNPGAGRPKKRTADEVLEDVAKKFKDKTGQDLQEAVFTTLVAMAMPGGNRKPDPTAMRMVLPYVLGNPVQKVEHTGENGEAIALNISIAGVTPESLDTDPD